MASESMTVEALKESLAAIGPSAFVETHLFDRIPAIFGDNRQRFVQWRGQLARLVEVDPACVSIVGSAAVGASLSPYKNFKPFNDDSDIDVAVVSNYHFTVGWRYLRMNSARRLTVDVRTRLAWDEHVKRYIYWGTLATDRLLGVLPFGLQWLKAIGEMSRTAPTIGRTVNLRIYNDYDSLRSYQINSVRALRDARYGNLTCSAT